jgi:hypothetical protein
VVALDTTTWPVQIVETIWPSRPVITVQLYGTVGESGRITRFARELELAGGKWVCARCGASDPNGIGIGECAECESKSDDDLKHSDERFADEFDDRDETPVEWGPLTAERWDFDNDPEQK